MVRLAGLNVLVLGLGVSGLAMARWCLRHGAQVSVWDSRDAPPGAAALSAEAPSAILSSAALSAESLAGVQLVLKSPGLAPHDPRITPLLAAARAAGVRVGGEIELFAQALADLKRDTEYAPKVIAITGTNGKTTTTALTALLVERSGRSVVAAGNIGPSMLDTLTVHLDAGKLPQVWVLELSSFQLQGLDAVDAVAAGAAFEPDAATVLNVTQDHLDWHGSMDAYAAAKLRVFGSRAVMVINRDDLVVAAMAPSTAPANAAAKPVKLAKGAPRPVPRTVIRFGLDAPQRPGDFGLVVENGLAWLVRALAAEDTGRRRKGSADAPEDIHLQRLMPADALRLHGRHNTSNALAALALSTAIGCALGPMLHGLRDYAGEPHRVQPAGRVGDVEAYDDSKGTNVGATVAALHGLGADLAPARLVVILGGDGKGQDFAPLAPAVAAHARAVALIGRDAEVIGAALVGTNVRLQRHKTLEAATAWCFEQAQPGDAVLLSPACASLDMFRSYAHRAEVFVAAVQALAAGQGEVLV